MSSPLERAVAVMDRLRSPGGCPWDAAQTHESLTRYLLEETYEVIEAIETADAVLLREELGDLLLQVLFHARLAQEMPGDTAFGIHDVAGDLVDKLVRRHPHVFDTRSAADGPADAAALNEAWEQNKIVEKGRTSALDGVPLNQPALALAAKLVSRVERGGLAIDRPRAADVAAQLSAGPVTSARQRGQGGHSSGPAPAAADAVEVTETARIGSALFALVVEADEAGVDPEGALRAAVRAYRSAIADREVVPGR